MKRLLIVSPHFPPVNAPDSQRVLGALPHLRSLGWDPRVLCVDPRDINLPANPDAAARVPDDMPIHRCRAWPLALTRLAGLRSLGPRAAAPLQKTGATIIQEWKPDLIFFSTTQNAVAAAGPRWKREFGIPFVVDIQDPWVTGYYDRPGAPKPPGGWKYAISRRLNARLEAKVFGAADGIVSVSADYLDDLAARHPLVSTTPRIVLPFGVDETAFQEAVAHARVPFEKTPGKIHLVSMGAVGPIMQSAVTSLCRQLKQLRERAPSLANRLSLHFIGTSYARGRASVLSVMPIARELGVDHLMTEMTERVPWREAQAGMTAADGLIVLTSDDPAYTPSKLAGCFLARRPVLMITRADSSTAKLGAELGLGTRLDLDGSTPDALGRFLSDLEAANPSWPGNRQDARFQSLHTTRARTRELASFFDKITDTRPHE